jgi:hypothetical protein
MPYVHIQSTTTYIPPITSTPKYAPPSNCIRTVITNHATCYYGLKIITTVVLHRRRAAAPVHASLDNGVTDFQDKDITSVFFPRLPSVH